MHYYQLNIKSYQAATSHLSNDEDLAYRRLMDFYYDTEFPISAKPNKPTALRVLSRRLRLAIPDLETVLDEFFTFDDECWKNEYCDQVIFDYKSFLEKQRANGSKGGRGNKANANPNKPKPLPKEPKPKPTINNKQETINHIKTISPNGFDLFWNAYNKKIGKPNAIKQWLKIKPSDDLVQTIVSKALADAAAKPDAKFRKDPERWLKGKHWEDEVIVAMPLERTELPLGSDQQIETAYRLECGGDPRQSRFGSYFEMKKFVIDHREKHRVRA